MKSLWILIVLRFPLWGRIGGHWLGGRSATSFKKRSIASSYTSWRRMFRCIESCFSSSQISSGTDVNEAYDILDTSAPHGSLSSDERKIRVYAEFKRILQLPAVDRDAARIDQGVAGDRPAHGLGIPA